MFLAEPIDTERPSLGLIVMIDDDPIGFLKIISEMNETLVILRLQKSLENAIDWNGLLPVLLVEKDHGTEGSERPVVVLSAVLKDLLNGAGASRSEQNSFVCDLQQSLFAKGVLKVLRKMAGDGCRRFVPIMPSWNG